MVNFTTGGFYLAFLFALVGALVVQARGQWRPGPFTLGRLSLPSLPSPRCGHSWSS